jgi:hypothetical protein
LDAFKKFDDKHTKKREKYVKQSRSLARGHIVVWKRGASENCDHCRSRSFAVELRPQHPGVSAKKRFLNKRSLGSGQELCPWEVCPRTTPRGGLHVGKLLSSPLCIAANLPSSKLASATSCRRKSSAHGSARTRYMASQVSARPAVSIIANVALLDPAGHRRSSRRSAQRSPPQFFDLIF